MGKRVYIFAITCLISCSCLNKENGPFSGLVGDTVSPALLRDNIPAKPDSVSLLQVHKVSGQPVGDIETGNVLPEDVVSYSKTLIGIPYKYASTDPAAGFDCSGFITYVFNHFGIPVPRSSVDFTDVGTEIAYTDAKPGDLILFTGTDSTERIVGHMGIVVRNNEGKLEFIHSTSGKAKGVVISPLESYYRSRFVKVIRIFPSYY